MEKGDFDIEYKNVFHCICPTGPSMVDTVEHCRKRSEGGQFEPGEEYCRKCWFEYLGLNLFTIDSLICDCGSKRFYIEFPFFYQCMECRKKYDFEKE